MSATGKVLKMFLDLQIHLDEVAREAEVISFQNPQDWPQSIEMRKIAEELRDIRSRVARSQEDTW